MQFASFTSASVELADEPIDLADAKAQLRVRHDLENDYIESLIPVAREAIENYCHRTVVKRVTVAAFEGWDKDLILARPPLDEDAEVTIEYLGIGGQYESFTGEFFASNFRGAAVVRLAGDVRNLPSLHEDALARVLVSYSAGYAEEQIPTPIIQALKLMVSHFYDNRAVVAPSVLTEVPMTVKSLLAPFRIRNAT